MSCSNRREEEAIVKKSKRRINGEGSIYRRKSAGRWVGQFQDPAAPGGGIRYVYAKTQQETLKKLKEEMARAEDGLLGEAGRTNVSEYLRWWMKNVVKSDAAHRTYHSYLSQIRNHILPALGKKELKALKLEDVESLYLRRQGRRGPLAERAERPGAISDRLTRDFAAAGFPMATGATPAGTADRLVEVYPHPALMTLTGARYRFPYKVSRIRKLVQHLLGHASITMTLDRYSHWIPSMGRHAADGMDETLG